jgi:putative transposase
VNRSVYRRELSLDDYKSLNHTKWECKYHIVFIPKCRRKVLYGEIKTSLGGMFRNLAEQRGVQVEEGHVMPDHVHMLLSIPPKYAVCEVVGFMKGKSAIYIARTFMGRRKNFSGESFWARGYFVSTVGRDEKTIREYIRNQEKEDKRLDQLAMFS